MKRLLMMSLLATVMVSCTDENPAYSPDPFLPGECRAGVEISETFEGYENPAVLDILIIIDDSGDVEDLQAALGSALPQFLDGLVEDGLNVQVAVATTDGSTPRIAPPGTSAEGCAGNTSTVVNSEQANWTQFAACNVQQGVDGDSYQQGLAVAEALITGAGAPTRAQARQLVLVVSNEDDCSHGGNLSPTEQPRRECITNADQLTSVKIMTDALLEVPNTPQGLMLAAISGPPVAQDGEDRVRPVCSSALGSTFSAGRLFEATQAFGPEGVFLNACVQEMDSNLQNLRQVLLQPEATSFCPARKLAHEPLWVQGRDDDDDAFNILVGEKGFVFEGVTSACENGALSLMPASMARAKSFEVAYCVEQ